MHDLPSVIEAELDAAKNFLSLLKEESDVLVAGDTDRLAVIAQKKSELLQKIGRLAQGREQMLPLAKISGWMRDHPEVSKTWQELTALALKIKQTNETNGKMIDIRLRGTQQALSVLQSLSRTTTNLYGPDGQSSIALSGSHSIESA
ncbi:MAG: flagella synthesis protein FlgN [Burkholderiales bacterium]